MSDAELDKDALKAAADVVYEHRVYPHEGAWYCQIDGPCDWWSWIISEHDHHVATLAVAAYSDATMTIGQHPNGEPASIAAALEGRLDAAESKLAAAERERDAAHTIAYDWETRCIRAEAVIEAVRDVVLHIGAQDYGHRTLTDALAAYDRALSTEGEK